MLADYEDIRRRIQEDPRWHDSHGVPRYDPFSPELCPNIYADRVMLYRIECQACGEKFLVEQHQDVVARMALAHKMADRPLEDRVRDGAIHYGDPPRHDCTGDTMNCLDLKVIEFWKKEQFEWARIAELEIELPDAKAEGEE